MMQFYTTPHKYTRFVSEDNKRYVAVIYCNNITTTEELIADADPLHIRWDKGDHVYVPMRSKSAVLRVLTDHDISDIYSESPLGAEMEIYECDINWDVKDCVFIGFVTPQEWECELSGGYHAVEMVAVDALTAIKDVKYDREVGERGIIENKMISPGYIITRAVNLINDASVGTDITFDETQSIQASINEQVFLPDDTTLGIHSSDRTDWVELLESAAFLNGKTLMMEGSVVLLKNIDATVTDSCQTVSYYLADARKSIEPARSCIRFSLGDSSRIEAVKPISSDDMTGTSLSEGSTSWIETEKSTIWHYFKNNVWEPTDGREGCGAMIRCRPRYEKLGEWTPVIVGPCHIKRSAQRQINCKASVKISAWGRTDLSKTSGYADLPIFGKSSNSTASITLSTTGTSGASDTVQLESNNEGFSEYERSWYWFTLSGTHFDIGKGLLDIQIPDGVVVSSISVTTTSEDGNTQVTESGIYKRKTERIINIDNGYNEELSISCPLNPLDVPILSFDEVIFSESDVFSLFDPVASFNSNQYSVPRRRYELTTSISSMSYFTGYSIPSVDSSKRYIADGADYDLRSGRVTLNLIQSTIDV